MATDDDKARPRGRTVGEKSPTMTGYLDELSLRLHGRTRSASLKAGICLVCGDAVGSGVTVTRTATGAWVELKGAKFRDQLSLDEYWISAMCQRCQDETFTPEPSA